MTLDRLRVSGIEAYGYHGVLAEERRLGQRFVVDVVLGLDTRAAAGSDDLRDTVDYGSLVTRVRQAIESDPVDLIETLAERLARTALTDRTVVWVEVTVHKPQAPIATVFADVALTIRRANPDADATQQADQPPASDEPRSPS